jgi:uridine kinase
MVPIPADAANPGIGDLARLVRAAPPRLGGRRLVLVDGPAGSGKTTLAARLGEALGAPVLHGDDMYEGWTGLGTLWAVLGEQVLEPLARGGSAAFRAWDWERSERGRVIEVAEGDGTGADALVVEGVGVAQRRARPYASLVVYVEAPWEARLARGIERDGEAMRADWERWQAEEANFLEAEGTRAAADVLIDGTVPVPD